MMYLLGYGHWGRRIHAALTKFGESCEIIDAQQGTSIKHIQRPGAVIIATPLHLHYVQALELLDRGYDIYVEKPMCERFTQILDLADHARPQQILMVGHLFQNHPQSAEIHTLIGTGSLGKLNHITSRRLNWGIYQPNTNPVLSIGIHDITIINDFVRNTPCVQSAQATTMLGTDSMDRVVWHGSAGDIGFDCEVSWAWPQRVRETLFMCEHGQIYWDQDRNRITITRHSFIQGRCVQDLNPEIIEYRSELSPLEHQIRHWLDCVRDRTLPRTGVQQARDAAEVAEQILRLL